jgi:transcriptional regulator with XRE-family HTH domain
MKKQSRKCLLTPRRKKALIEAARLGAGNAQMAQAAGIERTTLWRWMHRGRTEPKSKWSRLMAEIEAARAEVTARYLAALQAAAEEKLDVKAIKLFLERRAPEDWGPPQRQLKIDATVDASASVTVEPSAASYTEEELEQLRLIGEARKAREAEAKDQT